MEQCLLILESFDHYCMNQSPVIVGDLSFILQISLRRLMTHYSENLKLQLFFLSNSMLIISKWNLNQVFVLESIYLMKIEYSHVWRRMISHRNDLGCSGHSRLPWQFKGTFRVCMNRVYYWSRSEGFWTKGFSVGRGVKVLGLNCVLS